MDERSSTAFSTDDTIAAVATPAGRGALGIVRLSGASALGIASRILTAAAPLRPRYATFTRVRGHGIWPGDEVIATCFKAPLSYTGEDVVEISAHGSPVVLREILDATVRAGARLARPGEFTLRAYLNGKRDLVQAEAVADLIDAATPLQARVAFDQLQGTLTQRIAAIDRSLFDLIARLEASLDFPDEGYRFVDSVSSVADLRSVVRAVEELLAQSHRGRVIREGALVVIAGRPNVGKSLIFNNLNGSDRAIVTTEPGTTRDLITELVDFHGLAASLVDTAGIRTSHDMIEAEGIARAAQARAIAQLVVLVLDRSVPVSDEDLGLLDETRTQARVIVANKADLPAAFDSLPGGEPFIVASAKSGAGMDALRAAIACALTGGIGVEPDTVAMSNRRHVGLMMEALGHLNAACVALQAETPEEFVLSDLQAARARFDEVVGVRTSDEVIGHIFERFCIGK